MRSWSIALTDAPWWVLVLVAAGSLLELSHQHVPTIDAGQCASMCYPVGVASYSLTECQCRSVQGDP